MCLELYQVPPHIAIYGFISMAFLPNYISQISQISQNHNFLEIIACVFKFVFQPQC